MRESYYSKESLLSRTLMLLALLLTFGWSGAKAEGSGTADDPYVIKAGETLTMPQMKKFYAKFVVPEDVTSDDAALVLDGLKDMFLKVYSDAAYSTDITQDSWYSGSSPWTLKVPIPNGTAAGTTYYFYESFPMNTTNIDVTYGAGAATVEKPLTRLSVTPAEGQNLTASSSLVSLQYSRNDIKVTSCVMEVYSHGTDTPELKATKSLAANVQGAFVSIEPKTQLIALYNEGILEACDIIKVKVGVKAVSGDNTIWLNGVENSVDEISYIATEKPVMLTKTVNTPGNGLNTFLSWMPADYANGLAQLHFDGALDTQNAPVVKLMYGDIESDGEYYEEVLPVKFFGDNILAVDLRGKLRTPATMNIASLKVYDTITLSVKGVKAADGTFVYSDGVGSLGSFSFDYTYKAVEYATTVDFTPASGASIDNVKSIELWANETGDGKATFAGVQFAYTDGGEAKTVVVPMSQITSEADPDEANATIYTIPVPEFSRDADTQVVLTLTGLSTPDGLDHSADFTATYTTAGHTAAVAAVTSALMVSGDNTIDLLTAESIEKLIADSDVKIATSMDNAIGCMQWQVVNITTGETVKAVYDTTEKNDEGHWTFWVPIDYKFFEGNQYGIILKGWTDATAKNNGEAPIFEQTITVAGATKEYKYSSVTLVEPAELLYSQNEANFSLESAEDKTISFTFSDAVTVDQAFVALGFGETDNCDVAMSNDNKTVTLTIPDYVLSTYTNFTVSMLVKDAEGLVVKGNNGEEDNSFISVYVDAKFNLPYASVVEPAKDATVEKISSIKFGYSKGIGEGTGKIVIMDKLRNTIATQKSMTPVVPADQEDNWDYIPTEIIVNFDKEITAPGTYVVYVPEGVFNLDLSAQGFAVKSNHEETFSLTVDGEVIPEAPANVTVTPAAGNVESLNEIVLTFKDYETCAWTFAVAPTITLPNGETHNIKNYEFGAADNELKCTMPQTLTDEGTYVLTIPAGAVTYNDNPDNLNAAFSVTYIIKGKTADTYATASPAPGVVESLKDIYVTFNECGACAWSYKIMPTITLPDGSVKTLTNEEATYDWDNPDYRVVWVKLSEALTAPGDYVLNFPAGTLLLDEDMPSEAVSFTYTIEAGNTIDVTVNPAPGEVASLSSFVLSFADDPSLTNTYWNNAIDESNAPYVIDADGNKYACSYDYDWNGDEELMVTLSENITAAGSYKLVIPAGAVMLNGVATDSDIKFNYTVTGEGGSSAWNVTSDPANGSKVTSLETVILTFNDFDPSNGIDYASDEPMVLTDPNGVEHKLSWTNAEFHNGVYNAVRIALLEANDDAWTRIDCTTPGTYTLTIPANSVWEYNNQSNIINEDLVFTWTVVKPWAVEVTPENGSTVKVLEGVTVTFPDFTTSDGVAYDGETPLVLTDPDGVAHKITPYAVNQYEGAYNAISVILFDENNEEIDGSKRGTYTLTIPAGCINDYTDETNTNTEFTFSWNVEGIDVTVNPANGAEVESLKQISVTFGDYQVVDWNWAAVRETPLIFFDSMGDPVQLTIDNLDIDNKSTNTLLITLPEEYTAVGTYSLTIPSGYVVLNTTTQETLDMDLSFSWKIKGEPLTITPTPGVVDEIGMVFITFNDIDPNIGIVINQDAYNENPAVFTDKDGKETEIGFRRITQMYPTNNTIAITLPVDDNITEVGTYKLFIPANTVYGYLDKSVVYAEDINIEWTITTASGIYGIFAGKNEKVNVFTIDGKAVLKNADASDLKQLAPGKLYIINGKKFVVK